MIFAFLIHLFTRSQRIQATPKPKANSSDTGIPKFVDSNGSGKGCCKTIKQLYKTQHSI